MKCPIYNQKVGKYTYIIKADSVWDKLKGRSVRKDIERIGTIDADTGEAYYTEKYIDELRAEGQPTENLKSWEDARKAKKFTKAKVLKMIDVSLESLTNPGLSLFFDKLSIEIGLDKALQKAFSGEWHKVLVIASFMLVAKRPIMDCENWAETVGYQQLGSLTSQNISVIFRNITDEQRNALSDFYSDNMSYLERMAIDSTTVSTHSGQIGYAEYGKNKDNDHMKQVDVCFCFGTTSGLPVKIYYLNGSLTDVTTLKEVVAQFPPTLYAKNPLVIADRGYWSYDNVADLLHHELSFLIPSKLDSKFIISLIEKLRPTIETEGEVIINQGKRMLYRTIKASYAGGELFFHVIYDETKRYAEWIKLKDKVDTAFDIISSNPSTTISNKKYLCYLNFDKEDKNKVISINTEAINNAVKLEGWVIFASNTIETVQKAIEIYDHRNDIEVSFDTFKNMLGLKRLHVQSDDVSKGKCDIAFLALWLYCFIKNTLKEHNIAMSFYEVITELNKIREFQVLGERVIGTLTKKQLELFKAFGIETKGFTVNGR